MASRRNVPMTENLAKWLAPHAEKEGRIVPFDNVNKQIGWLVEDTNAGLKKADGTAVAVARAAAG